MINIIEQLVDIYLNKETWHKTKMSYEDAYKYHQTMFDRGNIIIWEKQGIVLGYVETWRVNFEQFGRLVCGCDFYADAEDCQTGKIAYLANTWIHENHRSTNVIKMLKIEWLRKHFVCDYFVGEARRKNCSPIKVFNRKNKLSLLEV